MRTYTPFAAVFLSLVVATLPTALTVAHAQNGYVTLSQYSGNPGSTVQVMGYGFMPNESLAIYDSGQKDPNVSTVTSDGNGNFSVGYTVPQVAGGSIPISAVGATDNISTSYYVNSYYPSVQPSSWYTMPGQMLSFTGNNFYPNEPVNLMVNGQYMGMMSADASGNVNMSNVYTVAWNMANQNLNFSLMGQWSNMSVPVTVGVGTYYPQINPSTYYVGMGQPFNLNGSGFAPNEQVNLMVGGMSMSTMADSSGNWNTNVMTPYTTGVFKVMATGNWSGTSAERTITAY